MHLAGQRWMKNKNYISKVWDQIDPILFPLRCPVCDALLAPEEIENGIHSFCRKKLYVLYGTTCMHCGRPLGDDEEYCLECQRIGYVSKSLYAKSAKSPQNDKTNKSYISQGKAIYLYRGEIKKSMYRFKYGNRRAYAKYFAKEAMLLYGDWIKKQKIQAIVPIPMFKRKQRRRGYNQAECFGQALSELLEIPLETKLIRRVKDTIPQKELGETERKNNLENAFQIEKSIVQYSHLLLIDDIYTTGSTAEAAAKELNKKGVCQIFVLSICIGGDM